MDWSLPDFLYHLFLFGKDNTGHKVNRSRRHAASVSRFLQGRSSYSPGQILHLWYTNPDGKMANDPHATSLMFSTALSYHEIKPVRAMLTSFAAQVIKKKLNKEAEAAVRPSNGLFVSTTPDNAGATTWVDVGAVTVSTVSRILQEHQPLTWHLLSKIACREPRKQAGTAVVRQRRPVKHVSHQNQLFYVVHPPHLPPSSVLLQLWTGRCRQCNGDLMHETNCDQPGLAFEEIRLSHWARPTGLYR